MIIKLNELASMTMLKIEREIEIKIERTLIIIYFMES